VRTIVDPSGKRRLHIIARADGHFGYAEERFAIDPDERHGVWLPVQGAPVSICDSLETAERQARASIVWLRHESTEE
jgi:hypothetical protein